MTGAWSLNEETMQFELQEPFKSKLDEGRTVATKAWMEAMMTWLSENSGYDAESLMEEFVRRSKEQDIPPMSLVESFVIEALEGNM